MRKNYWLKVGIAVLIIEILYFSVIFFMKCDNTERVGGGYCTWGFGNFIENLNNLFNEMIIVKLIAITILFVGFFVGIIIDLREN